MGTRADFYDGLDGPEDWLGSVAWDGYPGGVPDEVRLAEDRETFREAVAEFLADRDDGTTPERGWPWPWEDSRTTDYAYAWQDGEVRTYSFGRPVDADGEEGRTVPAGHFPDMSGVQDVTFGARSGLMVFRGGRQVDPDDLD